MMAAVWDYVVVGGRCAGAATAIFLARAGARVLVVDRDRLPSDYVVSTHTIHPAGMDVLDELGVGRSVRAVTPAGRVMRLERDGAPVDVVFGDGRAEYCPRRHVLDGLLHEAAREAGVTVWDRTRVVRLIAREGRAAGVIVERAGREEAIEAGFVVGADGRHSTVASLVGAQESFGYDAARAMFWAYWPAPPGWLEGSIHPFQMWVGHRGPAIRVAFTTNDDQILIGTMPVVEEAREWRRALEDVYRRDLESDPVTEPLVRGRRPASDIRGTLRERYYFREAAGAGWALVGDAGHHKDFVLGDGITDALRQSRALAAALVDGREQALLAWWRARDREALPLFRFAEDGGRPGPQPTLMRYVFRRVGRDRAASRRLFDGLERRGSPQDAVPVRTALLAVLDGLRAGETSVLRDFVAAGRRAAAVGREVRERGAARLELREVPATS